MKGVKALLIMLLEEKTDEELMVLYQLGDELAFTALFKRHSSRVYSYLKSKVHEDQFVQDIFQATFLKLHTTRSKYNSTFPFLPWLFTVCKNEMIDALRKQNRKQSHETLSETFTEAPAPEPFKPAYELSLNEVPVRQQEILKMRYQDELSFSEIANRLGTTSTNARQLVSRAIKSIRKIYGRK